MKNRIIYVDINDTIAQTKYTISFFMNNIYGNPLNLSYTEIIFRFRTISWIPFWKSGYHTSKIDDIVRSIFVNSNIEPIAKSQLYLNKMCKELGHNIIYLSARDEILYNITAKWLNKNGFPVWVIQFLLILLIANLISGRQLHE